MTKQYTKETDRIIAGILENDGKTSIEFGRIYFADFDQVRARERFVRVQIIGE